MNKRKELKVFQDISEILRIGKSVSSNRCVIRQLQYSWLIMQDLFAGSSHIPYLRAYTKFVELCAKWHFVIMKQKSPSFTRI